MLQGRHNLASFCKDPKYKRIRGEERPLTEKEIYLIRVVPGKSSILYSNGPLSFRRDFLQHSRSRLHLFQSRGYFKKLYEGAGNSKTL
jgi:hypothetical protein